ncbi:MAG TPA: FtsX-like permease family protein [Chitinispirillaceae bacterium]|nr:FtsX-like permease family protein [Chitinispirillaceae bacterium]
MDLILKISWRNILRHRGKSIVIGVILFLGALIMTAGNGVISGMDRGMQKNIVEGFTGDAMLISEKQESDNVFMEFMGKSVATIENFNQINSALVKLSYVKKVLPIGKNFAMALNSEGGIADGVFVLGVDFKKYRDFFGDNLKLVEGNFPDKTNEPFALIPTSWRKMYGEFYSIILSPEGNKPDTSTLGKEILERISDMQNQHDVVYMGMNTENTTTDVRVPVSAIVKYRSLNTIWGQFPILDIESYRECQGYFSAEAKNTDIKKEDELLLSASAESLDDLFSGSEMIDSKGYNNKDAVTLSAGSLASVKEERKNDIDLNDGIFNMILLRFTDKSNLDQTVKMLNKDLSGLNLGVRAIPWKKATGMIGSMAVLIKTSLFLFVMFLFFVAIIIIVNTLSMAALERTSEIGMMRAVGARKSFIRMMFLGETAVLSAVFGGAGIVVGIIAVNIVAAFNIPTDNDMVQLLFGGDTFKPFLSLFDIGLALIQLIIVTLIAVIYPIRVASNIKPLDAISRD